MEAPARRGPSGKGSSDVIIKTAAELEEIVKRVWCRRFPVTFIAIRTGAGMQQFTGAGRLKCIVAKALSLPSRGGA
jgi:hypothetical protein